MKLTPEQHSQVRSALRIAANVTRAKAAKVRGIDSPDNDEIAAEIERLAEGWDLILREMDAVPTQRAPRKNKSKLDTTKKAA